jgi:hypothetical protein
MRPFKYKIPLKFFQGGGKRWKKSKVSAKARFG